MKQKTKESEELTQKPETNYTVKWANLETHSRPHQTFHFSEWKHLTDKMSYMVFSELLINNVIKCYKQNLRFYFSI